MASTRCVRVGWISLVVCMLAGCASEDDRPPTFTYVYTTILQPSCATIGCHNRYAQTYGFRFDTLHGTYAYLTGVVCNEDEPDPPGEPAGNFVRPGDPERSKLMHLLRAEDVPRRMPPDRALPDVDIDLIERWILEGARCD
jgi:hypothetical protein